MSILKEAQSSFDFATYCPLLYKATAENESATPGYIFEEISKISFLSHQHRRHLLDFLLAKLSSCGCTGKQKVVKILHHICRRGHYEFRVLLRHRDGELRRAAAHGGPPDPLLANTPQLFFNSSINELLQYIFEESLVSRDNECSAKGDTLATDSSERVGSPRGHGSYGANVGQGKYIGFGNTPFNKPEGIVDQVREIVGKVVAPESRRKEELEDIMRSDKGSYEPLILQGAAASLSSSVPALSQKTTGPHMYSSVISHRPKAYVAGKVGGHWGDGGSGFDTAEAVTSLSEESAHEIPLHRGTESDCGAAAINVLRLHPQWPVDVEDFEATVRKCSLYNASDFLKQIGKMMEERCSNILSLNSIKNDPAKHKSEAKSSTHNASKELGTKPEQELYILLLLIEYSLHEEIYSINDFISYIQSNLQEIAKDPCLNVLLKTKAKKIDLILTNFSPGS